MRRVLSWLFSVDANGFSPLFSIHELGGHMASPEGSRPIVSEPLAARAAPLSKMSEKSMLEKMDLGG